MCAVWYVSEGSLGSARSLTKRLSIFAAKLQAQLARRLHVLDGQVFGSGTKLHPLGAQHALGTSTHSAGWYSLLPDTLGGGGGGGAS